MIQAVSTSEQQLFLVGLKFFKFSRRNFIVYFQCSQNIHQFYVFLSLTSLWSVMCRFREYMGKIINVLVPSFSTVWVQCMLPNSAAKFGFTASLKTEFASVSLECLDHAIEVSLGGKE